MKLDDLKPDLFTETVKTKIRKDNVDTETELKPVVDRKGLYMQIITVDSVDEIETVFLLYKNENGYDVADEIVFKTKSADENVVKLGKGELPPDYPRPSEEELNEFRKYISSHAWKASKTMADFCPHEYIINYPCWKKKEDGRCSGFCEPCKKQRAEFEHWAKFIRKYGERQKMLKTVYTVFCCDERQYWTMGDPMNTTWVLNRGLIDDPKRKPKVYWLDRV